MRIWEIARDNCRSSELDPGETWSSWTERSVYFAYHGCDLPVSTSRKRRIADIVPAKPSQSANSLSISRTNFNTDVSMCSNNTFAPRMAYSKMFSNANSQIISPVKHTSHRFCSDHPLNNKSAHYASHVSMPIDQTKMPVLIRMPALPHSVNQQVRNMSGKQRLTSDYKSRACSTFSQTNTIAEALSLVSDYPEEQRLVVEDAVVKQPLFNSLPVTYKNRITFQHKKTQRQLEATEARLRLFGDCSYVELPDGYTTIETQKGPRIVSFSIFLVYIYIHALLFQVEKTWGEELTPAVKITNRRFQAVKRFDVIVHCSIFIFWLLIRSFSSWPCEVADQVQPLSITMSRPLLPVRIAVLGSAWWADVFWFLVLPFTIVRVRWLPVLIRMDDTMIISVSHTTFE
uniref:Frizzled domain-containing protein n=1 Tax=Heterorhabditis bacteriophora TaxID=37862 RepID=A0A1I7XIY7_HETBA